MFTLLPSEEFPEGKNGLFETIPVHNGAPVFFKQHWERLRNSCFVLGFPFPFKFEGAREEIARLVLGNRWISDSGKGVLRLTYKLELNLPKLYLQHLAPRPASHEWKLYPCFVSPSALASHKTTHRILYDESRDIALEQGANDALLLDLANGQILETTRANLFVVRNRKLFTPAADGRILPGILRQWVIGEAALLGVPFEERILTRNEITAADEAFATNSVIGIVPVSDVFDVWGVPLTPGPTTRKFLSRYADMLEKVV